MDDEDDDDDDEPEDDDEDFDAEVESLNSQIPSIQASLQMSELPFESTNWGRSQILDTQPLKAAFQRLQASSREKTFPQYNRVCSVLDLRSYRNEKDDEKKEDDDNLYVFEPEMKCKKIFKDVRPLTFFHNSKVSVIPNPQAIGNPNIDREHKPVLASGTRGPQIMVCVHSMSNTKMNTMLLLNRKFCGKRC